MLEIFIGLILAAIVAYLVETFKMRQNIHLIVQLNKELICDMKALIEPYRDVDIFVVNELRTFLLDKFKKIHKIDDFKIYIIPGHKIRLLYRKGLAVQKIEILFDSNKKSFSILDLNYLDNPFESESIPD